MYTQTLTRLAYLVHGLICLIIVVCLIYGQFYDQDQGFFKDYLGTIEVVLYVMLIFYLFIASVIKVFFEEIKIPELLVATSLFLFPVLMLYGVAAIKSGKISSSETTALSKSIEKLSLSIPPQLDTVRDSLKASIGTSRNSLLTRLDSVDNWILCAIL